MGALRQPSQGHSGQDGDMRDGTPPELLSYESDISEEAVAKLRKKANAVLDQDEWVVIDGYVGDK